MFLLKIDVNLLLGYFIITFLFHFNMSVLIYIQDIDVIVFVLTGCQACQSRSED